MFIPDDNSCWPHCFSSITFPLTSLMFAIPESNGFTLFGGRDIVWTGNKTDGGRFVVVVPNGVKTRDDWGLKWFIVMNTLLRGKKPFKKHYRLVVKWLGSSSSSIGQQTPGMNKRLKQSESRNPDKFNNKLGQTLKSSQRPAVPNGVTQRFSPSLPSTSSICARNEQKNESIFAYNCKCVCKAC